MRSDECSEPARSAYLRRGQRQAAADFLAGSGEDKQRRLGKETIGSRSDLDSRRSFRHQSCHKRVTARPTPLCYTRACRKGGRGHAEEHADTESIDAPRISICSGRRRRCDRSVFTISGIRQDRSCSWPARTPPPRSASSVTPIRASPQNRDRATHTPRREALQTQALAGVGQEGLEPSANGLRVRCSTN